MWLDRLSDFIAHYKGLPTMVAVVFVIINFILIIIPGIENVPVLGWLAMKNVLLHLGIIVGFIGLLLDEALG